MMFFFTLPRDKGLQIVLQYRILDFYWLIRTEHNQIDEIRSELY